MKRCPWCGQSLPPNELPDIAFPGPVMQRIYNELRRAPRTPDELRELVWGYRDVTPNLVYEEVYQLRKKLRPHGLTIRCGIGRGDNAYRLVTLC